MTIEDIKLRVQATLDELSSEHLIPFKLTAHRVNADGPGKYVVPFYDSRIHSFEFSWTDGGSPFKEVVRAAVLDCVKGWMASEWLERIALTQQAGSSTTIRAQSGRFPLLLLKPAIPQLELCCHQKDNAK